MRDLQTISSGLEQALISLHKVLAEIRAIPDVIAQKEYHRRVMGAYLGFTEEKGYFLKRIADEGDSPGAQQDFLSSVQKHLDTIQQARREAFWLNSSDPSSVALTICMAFSFEIELAVALAQPRSKLLEMARNYKRWLRAQLDPTNVDSLSGIRQMQLEELDMQSRSRNAAPVADLLSERSGQIEVECLSTSKSSRAGSIIRRYTTIVTIPDYTLFGGYKIWKNNETPKVDGKSGSANKGNNWGYKPSITCDRTKGVINDEKTGALLNRVEAWINPSYKINHLYIRLAALDAIYEACTAALTELEATIQILAAPPFEPN